MRDSWCKPVRVRTGNIVSGGAAHNVRIAALGGMGEILEEVARSAVEQGLARADTAVRKRLLRVVRGARSMPADADSPIAPVSRGLYLVLI